MIHVFSPSNRSLVQLRWARPTYLVCKSKPIISSNSINRQLHFVLVHGSCHGAWCWYKVSAILKSAGHRVTALDMAASGVNLKQSDDVDSISDYFHPLIEFLDSLSPEECVVLVGHSMGGICITAAMERFSDKISAAVFAAANMPGPDFDYMSIAEKFAKRAAANIANMPKMLNVHSPTAILPSQALMAKFYRLSPPEDLELAKSLIRPRPQFPNESIQKVTTVTKEKYGSVPRVYIICDPDDDAMQRWMIEKNPPNGVKVLNGSDHMGMFSKPREFSAYLEEIGENHS